MRLLLALLALIGCSQAWATACPVTQNGITLNPTINPVSNRTTAITPFQVYYDATNTTTTNTLKGQGNTYQDVYYAVNWGDTDISGTTTWSNGANPGKNSKDLSFGPVGAHLYINTTGVDETYTPQIWAYDGTGIATCTLPTVTVYALTGSHGFTGTNLTCVSNSAITPGSGGCPSGAGTLVTTSLATATGTAFWNNNKAILFKCGDSFSGNGALRNVSHARVGAYGSPNCSNTSTNLPTFTGGAQFQIHSSGTDIAVSDLNFSATSGTNPITAVNIGTNAYPPVLINAVVYNVAAQLYDASFVAGGCSECAFVNLFQNHMNIHQTWFDLMGQRCVNNSNIYNCGAGGNPPAFAGCVVQSGSAYYNIAYVYVAGGFFSGAGSPLHTNKGVETVRNAGGSCFIVSNNTFENANDVGAVLKQHCGQGANTLNNFLGSPCYYHVISDNLFTGLSGGQLVETTAENAVTDERTYYAIVERNLFQGTKGSFGVQLYAGYMYETIRDNVFDGTNLSGDGIGFCNRGVMGSTNGGAAGVANWPAFAEVYNNTGINNSINFAKVQDCTGAPVSSSVGENNMFWKGGVFVNNGTGNTVSNNSTSSATNPNFGNASGSFTNITDYNPTNPAATGGATANVPNYLDGCTNGGFDWSTAYQLGALSPVCP